MNGDNVFEEFNEGVKDGGVSASDDKVERGKQVKCPNCGGNMVFDPQNQSLKCSHCGSLSAAVKNSDVIENDIKNAFENADKWDKTVVVRCENCGAKVVIDEDEVAKTCPYCGTSHIKRTDEMTGILPSAVYPFSKTAAEAEQFVKKWAKSKFFAPKKFKKNIKADRLQGVYEPCFTFDSDTLSFYKGRVGEHITTTVGSGKNMRTVTRTEWKSIKGSYELRFDDVTIAASSKTEQQQLNKIMPFDKSSLCAYDKSFLAGYRANQYDRDIRSCWTDAKRVMDKIIRKSILNQYVYDEVDYLNVSTTHNGVTYKYVLCPIYRMVYKFKKRNYNIFVNGTTGKVVGKPPVSFWRVFGVIAAAIGVTALLIWLFFLR